MAVATQTRLSDLALTLLSSIQTIFSEEGVDLPDRQHFTQGDEAYDCSALIVSLVSVNSGIPAGQDAGYVFGTSFVASATFRVTLIRNICGLDTKGNPPTATQIQDDAERLMLDAWILFDGMRQKQKAGDLFGSRCDNVTITPLVPVPNQGRMGGWTCALQVQLA